MLTQLDILSAEIDRCMLRDRRRLRRLWDGLRNRRKPETLQTLEQEIASSLARREAREAARPRPRYPAELPIVQRKDEIAHAISTSQVVIVCGETGSGKTTQLPKICLEIGRGVTGMIGHTQPRRLAARTLAARIATELEGEVGGTVGYKIRFTDRVSDGTYVKLMTDGILLAETQGDRLLEQYDTLIIDEAHERSVNIDFLLGYVKRLLPKRPDLKVIVTSATIDPQRFSEHFGGAPILEVSGRLYPVEIRYRPLSESAEDEDGDADAGENEEAEERAILHAIDELPRDEHDVLVFLPGEQAIRATAHALRGMHAAKREILPLYARLSAGEQSRVFRPHTGRRIILATNVAETSLTVPGVRYVVDTGLARFNRYDTRRKVQRLPIEKISQASANQRAGRSGRTAPGICIRLYSEEDYAARAIFTAPEIVRTNLAGVILQMAALGLGGIEEFPFIEPPQTRAVRDGAVALIELGALDEMHQLTRVGRELARLPVDPRVGRIILGGRDHGCLAEVLVIAAALSVQDPRERPHDAREKADQAHRPFQTETSDFVAYLKLWDAYQEQAGTLGSARLRKWCEARYLSPTRMREWGDVHRQLSELVKSMGFSLSDVRADDATLHKALLTGYLGSVAMKLDDRVYVGAHGVKLGIFPGSGLFKKPPPFIVAAEVVETGRLYARTVAKIEPEWIEPLAEHVLERRYFEPHWEKTRGQVIGFEKVLLYGIPIVGQRRVDFARVDAEAAREIMLRDGLVKGELRSAAPFLAHNRQIVADAEALTDRARRRDLTVDEQAVFAFYDKIVPADVTSAARFESWRKIVERGNPRALFLNRDDVLVGEAASVTSDDFPDELIIGATRLPLTYRFDPGHEEDGLTVTLPLAALGEIEPAPFEWLVPGHRVDKVHALLESLPKAIRKTLGPLRETAEQFSREVPFGRGSLATALSEYLGKAARVEVSPSSFQGSNLPQHLQMRFRVLDDENKIVGASRDLGSLQRTFARRALESFARLGKGRFERDRLTAWDFGDLPERAEIPHGSFTLVGYPGLSAEGDGVALRVFADAAIAATAHRRGLRRLFAMRLGETAKSVRRNLPGIQALSLKFALLGGGDALRDDIMAAAVDRVCFGDDEPIRTRDAFERAAEQARGQLAAAAADITTRVASVLTAHQAATRFLPNAGASTSAPWPEIRDHLARLVYPGFISETPGARLADLERYLKAVAIRVERLRQNPAKDRERAAQIAPLWQQYVALADAERDIPNAEMERYRWLLEEWRVSLFAQELRTAEPVSEKKLAEQWAKATSANARRRAGG
jgi:ATP-dependent helicase HrpA